MIIGITSFMSPLKNMEMERPKKWLQESAYQENQTRSMKGAKAKRGGV
jgi:hypothetical protein